VHDAAFGYTAQNMYEVILTSTRIVQSHLSVEDVIDVLKSENDLKKDSFFVAGSLEYDP
jgi:hypothetical protein